MRNKKLVGITIATAAALTFTVASVAPAYADSSKADVKCFGANSCKGKSSCKTAHSSCKGMNSCKGKGVSMMSSKKACAVAGGKTSEGK